MLLILCTELRVVGLRHCLVVAMQNVDAIAFAFVGLAETSALLFQLFRLAACFKGQASDPLISQLFAEVHEQ